MTAITLSKVETPNIVAKVAITITAYVFFARRSIEFVSSRRTGQEVVTFIHRVNPGIMVPNTVGWGEKEDIIRCCAVPVIIRFAASLIHVGRLTN
jgi:hypothetical protein